MTIGWVSSVGSCSFCCQFRSQCKVGSHLTSLWDNCCFQGPVVFKYLPLLSHNSQCSEQLCAFCYRGERSLLGQGELKMFGPTPGYVPLHIRNRRGSSENDTDVDRSPERDTTK